MIRSDPRKETAFTFHVWCESWGGVKAQTESVKAGRGVKARSAVFSRSFHAFTPPKIEVVKPEKLLQLSRLPAHYKCGSVSEPRKHRAKAHSIIFVAGGDLGVCNKRCPTAGLPRAESDPQSYRAHCDLDVRGMAAGVPRGMECRRPVARFVSRSKVYPHMTRANFMPQVSSKEGASTL